MAAEFFPLRFLSVRTAAAAHSTRGGHLTTVAKQFEKARKEARLPIDLVLLLRASWLWN